MNKKTLNKLSKKDREAVIKMEARIAELDMEINQTNKLIKIAEEDKEQTEKLFKKMTDDLRRGLL